jgi:hypothetical protein
MALRMGRSITQRPGIPPGWIGGETKVVTLPSGHVTIELQLALLCDEPRFLTYLTAFQAEFLRKLYAIEPGAEDWFSGVTWRLHSDPMFEIGLPSADYWQIVASDREITARQKGAMKWDPDAMRHHFLETEAGDLVDLADTWGARAVEDIRSASKR